MGSTVQELIAEIVSRRQAQLPEVERRIAAWRSASASISDLNSLLDALPSSVRKTPDVLNAASELFSEQTGRDIDKAVADLEVVARRFSRSTVTIGVSGQARTGKSTLLQSISGLGDEQIPSGSGLPVTAVRSRIFNVTGQRRAVLTLHTYESFARDVLGPLHAKLGIAPPPSTPDEYVALTYPSYEDLSGASEASHESSTLLQRLRGIQKSLPAFRQDLIGGQRTVSLHDLRPFVAYPSQEDEKSGVPSGRYLAVRDVRIETEFPFTDVDRLGLLDLPGLGEVDAASDDRHVRGLQDDVDVVILVKRPLEGQAFWKSEDAAIVQVLDVARGDAGSRRDFLCLLVNRNIGDQPHLVSALKHSILHHANEGQDGRHFAVLEADAADDEEVNRAVLIPVLEHMATRLPSVDRQVLEAAERRGSGAAERVLAGVQRLRSAVIAESQVVGSVRADVSRRAEELHRDIAVRLNELTQRLRQEAGPDSTDKGFIAAVEEATETAIAWINDGYDDGDADTWRDNALRAMSVQAGPFKVAEDAFNAARVGITTRFAEIDEYVNQVKVAELLTAVADVLGDALGELVAPGDSRHQLETLTRTLEDCPDPCPTLTGALWQLLGLRFDFRYQTYPRIREELDRLRLQVVDPETGELRPQLTVEASAHGARQLQTFLRQRAIQAAYETQKAVVMDIGTPAKVLHSAAEIFDDAFIRGRSSAKELENIAHAYRDEIWPGVYQGVDSDNARVRLILTSCDALERELSAVSAGRREGEWS